MDQQSVLGNNDIDDVRWLCSLTESELDFLMSLKYLANLRAQKIGHEALAKKFDLRTLRALSYILMEHLTGKLKDLPATSGFSCNLLNPDLDADFASLSIEEINQYVCSDKRKRIAEMFSLDISLDMPPSQKQKTD